MKLQVKFHMDKTLKKWKIGETSLEALKMRRRFTGLVPEMLALPKFKVLQMLGNQQTFGGVFPSACQAQMRLPLIRVVMMTSDFQMAFWEEKGYFSCICFKVSQEGSFRFFDFGIDRIKTVTLVCPERRTFSTWLLKRF